MKQQAILQWQIIRTSSILTFAWQFNKTEMTTTVVCLQGCKSDSVPGLGGGPLQADGQTISDVKVLLMCFHSHHLPSASLYICKFIEQGNLPLLKFSLLTLRLLCLFVFV